MKNKIDVCSMAAVFSGLCLLFSNVCLAQNDKAPYNTPKEVTNTFLIKDVYVITQPGQTSGITNILIKEGLIKNIGNDFPIPSDVKMIKADSMYVYAGFIDALSHTGIPTKEEKANQGNLRRNNSPRTADPGNPDNKTAGITPELQIKDLIDPKDKSIASMRKAGFTISHVVPNGKMLPGSGSVILLAGDQVDAMILEEDVSLYSQFTTSRGMFPSTVIGIMAKWRELYTQAKYAKHHESNYEKFPNGMKRPHYDRATKALYPVIEGQKPVFFRTPTMLNIHRALTLHEELAFPIILSEVKQGWQIADRLKSGNISVLLSHDIPKSDDKKKAESEDKKEKSDKKKEGEKEEKVVKEDPETKALKERKAESIKDYQSQASQFEKKGIAFAFSHISGKAKDFKSNLKIMIDNGLSEKAALAAITTYPAKLLGISQIVGTVETGKLANLVICDKSYFEEKSEIKYVFVEGNIFDYKKPKKKKKKGSGDEPTTQLEGTWVYELTIPGETPKGKMTVSKDGDEYKAIITSDEEPDDPEEVDDLEVDGNEVYFKFTIDNNGFSMELEFNLKFEEDSFEGNVSLGELGTYPISGERIDPK